GVNNTLYYDSDHDLDLDGFDTVVSIGDVVNIYQTVVIENAIGGNGNDTILGNFADNILVGRGGADTIYGGNGDDLLDGGAGNDTLNGGNGFDIADYSAGTSNLTANLAAGTASSTDFGTDSLVSIEGLFAGSGNDTVTGSSGD